MTWLLTLTAECTTHEVQLAREMARRLAEEKGFLDVDRVRPRPDPQDTGLVKGNKS